MSQSSQVASVSIDSMRSYLQEISRVPLLDAQAEIEYGRAVQLMMNYEQIKELLIEKLTREPSIEEWAEAVELTVDDLETSLAAGNLAKRKMVESNLRLVVNIAKRYRNRNVDMLDLIQEGSLGLQRGVEKFDPSRGFRFSTYAYAWINQAITRAIAQSSRTIRLPIHVTELLNKVLRLQRELSQQLGRLPTVNEIGLELNLKPQQVRQLLEQAKQPISLEMRFGENSDTELGDMLEDEAILPTEYIEKLALSHDLQAVLRQLPSNMREIITIRFGLDGKESLSAAEVGRRLGISRERVRQLQQKAYQLIRQNNSDIRHYIAS